MKQTLLRELRSNLDYMSNVERRLAEVILKDPRRFVSYSLGELAELAQVSQGSIINFANKFCGGGFPALKMEVAASLPHVSDTPFSVVTDGDSLKEMLQKTTESIGDALKNTSALNDEETLRAVGDLILGAKKVEIYGIFRSAVVATDFYFQLLQLGIPATFVSDVLTCAVSASMLGEGSLVIAISSSGQTQDVIDAVRLAKANGVPVITITAHKASPLAQLADRVLIAAPSGNARSANANEVRLSQLALTDALCSYLRTRLDADGNNRYFKMNEILSSHNVKD
ncbi:MAG: MurR/RpiR family transcriptional regulator [Clostridia bacterium]|nr:MurR/RpiR family transcriptional regulator [Clostridia bacterium]MBQ8340498.1 MurR/RpiR family transcriptional regulator [Clostridia bacterium]